MLVFWFNFNVYLNNHQNLLILYFKGSNVLFVQSGKNCFNYPYKLEKCMNLNNQKHFCQLLIPSFYPQAGARERYLSEGSG